MLKRLHLLMIKLTSVKGLAFALATVFRFQEKLDCQWWAAFALIIIGWRAFEKVFSRKN